MRNYTFLYIQLTKKQNLAKNPRYLLLFKDYCLLFRLFRIAQAES